MILVSIRALILVLILGGILVLVRVLAGLVKRPPPPALQRVYRPGRITTVYGERRETETGTPNRSGGHPVWERGIAVVVV